MARYQNLLIVVMLLCGSSPGNCAVTRGPLRTVALSGQNVGGPEGIEVFDFVLGRDSLSDDFGIGSYDVDAPLINNRGQVAFTSSTNQDSTGRLRRQGLWLEGSGGLSLVAGEGNSLPGVDSEVTMRFIWGDFILNDRGDLAFKAILADSSNTTHQVGEGIWAGNANTLRKLATDTRPRSEPAAAIEFLTFQSLSLNNQGDVAFTSQLALPGDGPLANRLSTGAWTDVDGTLQLAVLQGDQVATPSGEGSLTGFYNSGSFLDDSGNLTFFSGLEPEQGNGLAAYWQVSDGNRATYLYPFS